MGSWVGNEIHLHREVGVVSSSLISQCPSLSWSPACPESAIQPTDQIGPQLGWLFSGCCLSSCKRPQGAAGISDGRSNDPPTPPSMQAGLSWFLSDNSRCSYGNGNSGHAQRTVSHSSSSGTHHVLIQKDEWGYSSIPQS